MNILLIFLGLLLIGCVYTGIRNYKVYIFVTTLNNMGFTICTNYLHSIEQVTEKTIEEYERLRDLWNSIVNIGYYKMVFSFKPLKLKYWLTEEQIEFLKQYK